MLAAQFQHRISGRDESDPLYVTELVEEILAGAREMNVSDVHLVPTQQEVLMHWRIDGVLQQIARFSPEIGPRIVARLKVLAQLLTYQSDVPQEGRILASGEVETRVSTFPTLFGEKTVVRLFAESGRFDRLDTLGFPEEILAAVRSVLGRTGGVFIVTGPAGSGKTTTNYACLRELVDKSAGGKSLVSLEDPIEVVVPGVAQSQVNASAGFDLAVGLRSLMRQDPEVIMVGEIRDREVAEIVFQASLTGHLVITTFHAGSAAGAVSRLADMSIEPYLLKSGLFGILSQRLVRRLCNCAQPGGGSADRMGLDVEQVHIPVGCDACRGTGYLGRFVLAEMFRCDDAALGETILTHRDTEAIHEAAVSSGMVPCDTRVREAVERGLTSPAEVRRVFGF